MIKVVQREERYINNRWILHVLSVHGLQEVQWELPVHFYMYVVLCECGVIQPIVCALP